MVFIKDEISVALSLKHGRVLQPSAARCPLQADAGQSPMRQNQECEFYRRWIIVGEINSTHFNHPIALVYSYREVMNRSNCSRKDSHYKSCERRAVT